MMPNSLASRLLLILSLWLLVALVFTGLYLSSTFKSNAEKGFQDLLLTNVYNLMGEIDVDQNGTLVGQPKLGDSRFLQPLSGWYWSVSEARTAETPALHSASITGEKLEAPSTSTEPFSEQFTRSYTVEEAYDAKVQRVEAQLYLGDSDILYQVMVAGNRDALEKSIFVFNQTLLRFFLLFGAGTILASFLVIRIGLKPLSETTRSLQDIREGRAEKLDGVYPDEIAPLANEINALISANRSVTERARTQVGNLAHALKTPLAVVFNETRSPTKDANRRIEEQANLMQSQISTYLDRARIAAQRGTITARTEVEPVVEKMLRVMAKLFPDKEFSYDNDIKGLVFSGEVQDLEEVLGNLLENASRFAKLRVQIRTSSVEDEARPRFCLQVEDDGPGLSEPERKAAQVRGKRLDESTPGSGLGLSIVRDIADEYEGGFELGTSEMGGLKAAVILPRSVVS